MEQRGRDREGREERQRATNKQQERESNSCHRLGAVCAIGIETDKYRNKGPRKRFREVKRTNQQPFDFKMPF